MDPIVVACFYINYCRGVEQVETSPIVSVVGPLFKTSDPKICCCTKNFLLYFVGRVLFKGEWAL